MNLVFCDAACCTPPGPLACLDAIVRSTFCCLVETTSPYRNLTRLLIESLHSLSGKWQRIAREVTAEGPRAQVSAPDELPMASSLRRFSSATIHEASEASHLSTSSRPQFSWTLETKHEAKQDQLNFTLHPSPERLLPHRLHGALPPRAIAAATLYAKPPGMFTKLLQTHR
jgi:hypothetical protein